MKESFALSRFSDTMTGAFYRVFDENGNEIRSELLTVSTNTKMVDSVVYQRLANSDATKNIPELLFFFLHDPLKFQECLLESVYDSQCLYYPLADYGTESICISFTDGEIDLLNTIVKL